MIGSIIVNKFLKINRFSMVYFFFSSAGLQISTLIRKAYTTMEEKINMTVATLDSHLLASICSFGGNWFKEGTYAFSRVPSLERRRIIDGIFTAKVYISYMSLVTNLEITDSRKVPMILESVKRDPIIKAFFLTDVTLNLSLRLELIFSIWDPLP